MITLTRTLANEVMFTAVFCSQLEFLKDEISFLQIEQHPPPSPPPLGIDMEAPFPPHDKLPQGLSLTMSQPRQQPPMKILTVVPQPGYRQVPVRIF